MNQLQRSLRINAIFSGISGVILVALSKQINTVFGTNNPMIFMIVGIVLILFAGTIVYEIFKQRRLLVLFIIMQDFLWVAGSIAILLINPFGISKLGNYAIAIVALIVLFMAVNQSKALARVNNSSTNSKY